MTEFLAKMVAELAASPILQMLVAALSTFVLEDPTTVGCGLLVVERKMSFLAAFTGVSLGIAVGDLGLYGIGRAAGPRVSGWGPITPERLERGSRWFERNVVTAVFLSRFVPGMRLPTYVAAGVLKAPLWRFSMVVVVASILWTFLLLRLTIALGERILPLLGRYRWSVAVAALLVLVLLQRRSARRWSAQPDGEPVASPFEFWPPWLFYLPVAAHWLWLALKHRGLLLPTAANPSIYSGGFIGESKSAILDLVPEAQRRWLARHITVEAGADGEVHELARARLAEAGLELPVVAKPDVGQRGAGIQPITNDDELAAYAGSFPAGARFLLQEMVPRGGGTGDPGAVHEAGVMYWRMPGEDEGTLFSITLKLIPELLGDGASTVGELIEADSRARRLRSVYRRRHRKQLDRVPLSGERVPLVFAGNHCQGAVFKDGTALATPELERRIHEIASAIPGFYFGRFDLCFADLEAFRRGEDFAIIEINGASAEATHIWDASVSLGTAYRTLFAQFSAVFAIGAANRRRGHEPLRLRRVVGDLLAYRRLARTYPGTR